GVSGRVVVMNWLSNAGSIHHPPPTIQLTCERTFPARTLGAASEDTTTCPRNSVIPRRAANAQVRRSRLRVTEVKELGTDHFWRAARPDAQFVQSAFFAPAISREFRSATE